MRPIRISRTAVAILVALQASAVLAGGPAGEVAALPQETKAFLVAGLREANVLSEAASTSDEGIAAALMDYYFNHKGEVIGEVSDSETIDIVVCLLDRHVRPAGPAVMEANDPLCRDRLVPADH